MSLRFIQSYPTWFVLLCLLLGLLYAGILYYRNRRTDFPKAMLLGLSLLRFFAVSLLALLLLSPLLQRLSRFVEEPLLIFVQDNSQSLIANTDSAFYQGNYLIEKEDFLTLMERNFETRSYHFGEAFRESETTDYSDRYTDISAVFSGIQALYSNRNVGAVVIASDGIYNRGSNPVFLTANLPYPAYTLALGDTLARRDLVLRRINHNRITYLGNRFPVEVEVEARELAGQTSRLRVSREGVTLLSRNLQFEGNLHLESILLELEAETPGMQRYTVELIPVEGEITTANNRQDFFIEVIDSRQKVLILANSPHPDVGAIRLALEENDNYEVTSSLASEFGGQFEAFNLVILHQLPSARYPLRELLQRLERSEVPALFVVGAQTSLPAMNSLRTGLTISPRSADFTEAQPALNSNFPLFTLDEQTANLFAQLPPLHAPFASYQAAAGTNTLLFQKIGAVVTEQPLILFSEAAGRKSGVIAGEGLWRWRLQAFARTGSHQGFDELMWRMVQFLSLKEDKNMFRLNAEHFLFETDPAIFEAELYNPSYELINEPTVNLIITNEEGVNFTYEMGRTSNAYRLNAGTFPPGEYSYVAQTSFGGELQQATGQFSVSALNIEGLRTVADHNLLFQMAENSGGAMFYPGQWEELAQAISARDDILPVMYTQKEFHEMINLKAIFVILLLLLSAEWFIRKWNGSY
ncbi:MAG: hypothetical protein K0B09_07760 [Bacteroidales bacterium]|nr:hypothetical protein [Bacteroidales bacterium]